MTAPPREISATWAPLPGSADHVRQLLAAALVAWQPDSLVDAVRLVAGELVDNAVEHARTDVTVSVQRLPDGVLVRVHDRSAARPQPASGEAGHGLARVAALSEAWGVVEDGAGGKAVWALISE